MVQPGRRGDLACNASAVAIYDSYAVKRGIDFTGEDAPDAATLPHFRHLLEEKKVQKQLFETINRCLEAAGAPVRGGAVADAG